MVGNHRTIYNESLIYISLKLNPFCKMNPLEFCILFIAFHKKDCNFDIKLQSFLTKSTLSGGINRIHDEIPPAWDEIRLDGGWI